MKIINRVFKYHGARVKVIEQNKWQNNYWVRALEPVKGYDRGEEFTLTRKTIMKYLEKKTEKKKREMDNSEKLKRYGKVVGRYKSKTSDNVYVVRLKGKKATCNCKGFIFHGYCRHTEMAKKKGAK